MIFHGNALCNVNYFHRFPVLMFLDQFISWGNMGVEIFLLLAGISSYYSFSSDPNELSYYKKRAKRIYLPVLLICLPYWIWQFVNKAISVKTFLLDISLMRFWVTGNQQIWFVSAIAVFYTLYPLIQKMFERAGLFTYKEGTAGDGIQKMSCLIELIIVVLGFIFCIYSFSPEYYKLVEIGLNRLPIFILGVWLGPIVKYSNDSKIKSVLMLFLVLTFGFYLLWLKVPQGIYKRWLYEIMGTPLTILSALAIERAGKIIRAGLRFFGQMSLELYLAHIVIINLNKAGLFFPYSPSGAKKYLILMCISVAVACAAYYIQLSLKHTGKGHSA